MPVTSPEVMPLMQLMEEVHFAIANTRKIDKNLKPTIKWSIHCALRELVERSEHAAFRVVGTIAVKANIKTYPLPADFHREIEDGVKLGSGDRRPLFYMSEQQYDELGLDASESTGDPDYYMIRGRAKDTGEAQITLWPTPNVDRTLKLNYCSFPEKLWNADDTAFIDKRVPPEYHHVLVSGALRHMPRYVSDSDWMKFKDLWETTLKEAQKKAVQVTGQSYQRDAYTSGFTLPMGRAPTTLTGPSL